MSNELPAEWATMLHYPDCWDTATYPTLKDAIHEALAWSGCSVCKPAAQPERQPSPKEIAWDRVRRSCVVRNVQVTIGDLADTMDATLDQEVKKGGAT